MATSVHDALAPAAPPAPATAPATDLAVEDAYATLIVAFAADPVIRWVLPDAARYVTHYPRMLVVMGGPSLDHGSLDVGPGNAATAMWHPPGVEVDEETLGGLMVTSVEPTRQPAVGEMLERMDEFHPDEPCWYLPFIGVDPARQGRGLGSALLRAGLDRADRDGVPAYLEASSQRNRALYERHGFETLGVIQVDDSPPMWPMRRRPS